MYIVYVLQDASGKFYKGMTNDLERRIAEHKRGHTQTTRSMTDISVIYTETFKDILSARKRELYFKSAAGRRFLKEHISPMPL
ncbi:MAG: GIY-YIG nuclease family protein [Minisyncoccia bacterium]